jgi:hypothetical protein
MTYKVFKRESDEHIYECIVNMNAFRMKATYVKESSTHICLQVALCSGHTVIPIALSLI